MLKTFHAKTWALGENETALWPALSNVPPDFTLYGESAWALRYASSYGIGFDLRSALPLSVSSLENRLPFLAGANVEQHTANTIIYSIWGDDYKTSLSFS